MAKLDGVDISNFSHQALKDIGNRHFASSQFQEALQYYTLAINKASNISTYYSNRALVYVQLQDYVKAIPDCRRAIELDEGNLKAYFYAGQAHLGLGQYDDALAKLVHAHNLALEQHRDFGDSIISVIRFAKRKRFEAAEEKRLQQEIGLQTYLNRLIIRDGERQKESIVASCKSATQTGKSNTPSPRTQLIADSRKYSCPKLHSNSDSSIQVHVEQESEFIRIEDQVPEVQEKLAQITIMTEHRITEVADLFAEVDARRRKREVPECLCDRISFELMLDPVITPSGITYDRRSIIAHLRQVGHFDPVSRQPLTESQLIPNLAMKEVVRSYLEQNPWAESY